MVKCQIDLGHAFSLQCQLAGALKSWGAHPAFINTLRVARYCIYVSNQIEYPLTLTL